MLVHFQSFTATASGSIMKQVACEKCRTSFYYQLARSAKGEGSAPYGIGQRAASERAQRGANAKVQKMLQRDSDVVPCPRCDHIQANMLRDLRRRMYRTLRLLAWAIPLAPFWAIVSVGLIERSNHPYRFERDQNGYLIAAAICIIVMILIFLMRYWITLRI